MVIKERFTKDLSAQYPEQVKNMSAMWGTWAYKAHVYPMPSKEEKQPINANYISTPWEYPNF